MSLWISAREDASGLGRLRAGWRFAIFLLLVVGIPALAVLALRRGPGGGSAPAVLLPLATAANEALLLGWVALISWLFSKLEQRPMGDYGLPARGAFRGRFWAGVGWGAVALTALLLLMAASGGLGFGGVATRGGTLLRYGLEWALAFLAVGFFEEFSFRGYALVTLQEGLGFWPAAILLSAAFGAVHLGNGGETYIGGLSAGLIGLFFCFTWQRTGTLWFAVGMHATWDYCESFVYGVPDSGTLAPGRLLAPHIHGSRWITGGSVGPEGSVWVFIVIGLLFWIFGRVYPAPADRQNPNRQRAPSSAA